MVLPMFRSPIIDYVNRELDRTTGKLRNPIPGNYHRLEAGAGRNSLLRDLSIRDFFSLSQQRYIPIHAIVYTNAILKRTDGKITDITYTKPRIHARGRGTSKLSQNIINRFTTLHFPAPLGTINSETYRTELRFLNQAFNLYVGPGLLFDEDGKILAAAVLDKSLFELIAKGEETQNLNLFYSHLSLSSGIGLQKILLKKFGSLIISKDFLESRKYRNLYNNFISTFVKGEDSFQLNLIITDNVEESTFNQDFGNTVNYSSTREKVEEQKSVWREVLKEY